MLGVLLFRQLRRLEYLAWIIASNSLFFFSVLEGQKQSLQDLIIFFSKASFTKLLLTFPRAPFIQLLYETDTFVTKWWELKEKYPNSAQISHQPESLKIQLYLPSGIISFLLGLQQVLPQRKPKLLITLKAKLFVPHFFLPKTAPDGPLPTASLWSLKPSNHCSGFPSSPHIVLSPTSSHFLSCHFWVYEDEDVCWHLGERWCFSVRVVPCRFICLHFSAT